MDLALNNRQKLTCHKAQQTKPNQPTSALDMKMNHLMLKLLFLSFWECRVPFIKILLGPL